MCRAFSFLRRGGENGIRIHDVHQPPGKKSPPRGRAQYVHWVAESYALTFPGSQMLIRRVSGIRKRASTKHTAGTVIG